MVKLVIEKVSVSKSQSTEWEGTCKTDDSIDTASQNEIPSLAGSHQNATSNLFPSWPAHGIPNRDRDFGASGNSSN
jgi:hypothetical protein